MQLKPLAFAAAAAAMLIVPETSEQGEGVFKALPVHADTLSVPSSAVAQTVRVPCAQCKGSDTQLKLDFAVEGGSRLMLNGFELYPTADPWNGDLSAVVVKADGHEKEQRLGYSLSIEPEAVDQDLQMQLIAVELRVIEVGSRFVEGVPTVRLQVLRAADDEIAIANVALIESPVSGCTTMLCRAKHLTGDMLKSLKGFKGGKGCGRHRNKGHPHHDGTGPGGVMPLHGGRPPHPHPHRPHPHHHHMGPHRHDWRKLMKNVASHIFLPVLMGITAGVGVAVIAMVLCSVLVRVTRLATCNRAGARCCRRKQATPQQDSDVEKVGLMSEEEHEEPPPQYRDDETK